MLKLQSWFITKLGRDHFCQRKPQTPDQQDTQYMFLLCHQKKKVHLTQNGYANYNVTITNLCREKIVREPSGNVHFVTLPTNGSLGMKTSYILVEKTDSPYFHYGLTLIVLAMMLAVLPYLPLLMRKTAKIIRRS